MISNALEIAGFLALSIGAFLLAIPVGFVTLGVTLIVLGVAVDETHGRGGTP